MTQAEDGRKVTKLFKEPQAHLFEKSMEEAGGGPVECLGQTFEDENARRGHFLDLLKQKLKEPEFRATPGFPNATDEAILSLSDPPYYTACPNPFLQEFIEWASTPDSGEYQSAPLTEDVSEGKNDPVYSAHSYHTKVPPNAIARYIQHYTVPGDLVLDGFCGTGMTGVASLRGPSGSSWAGRNVVLCDLSPLATFIASNLTSCVSDLELKRAFEELMEGAEREYSHLYRTKFASEKEATLNYAVWSDCFLCTECSAEFTLWEASIDLIEGVQRDPFECPQCSATLRKRTLGRAFESSIDPVTRESWRHAKRALVYVCLDSKMHGRESRKPTQHELVQAVELAAKYPSSGCPTWELPKGDRYYKDGLHLVGLDYTHRFYFSRTLHVLSYLWSGIEEGGYSRPLENRLRFVLTSMIDRNLTIRNRFVVNRHNPKGRVNGPLANTLYVPGLSVEQNPLIALRYKKDAIAKAAFRPKAKSCITTQSASSIPELPNSIDYIFVDPPFGHNIMYSELNGLTESWLGVHSAAATEAVVSEAQEKSIELYATLMESCFSKFFSLLKPGRWMTVEFHNSKASVWNAIQNAISRAGFVIADVRMLDKKKGTINQEFYTAGAVKTDLVISAYKPISGCEAAVGLVDAGEDVAWSFVAEHLAHLPLIDQVAGQGVTIEARKKELLYDRMLAFHVQRGAAVPLSAAAFYAGLEERYPSRDNMYFLPAQLVEYERKRMGAGELRQLSLFINDEASAVRWVRQQLQDRPQSFQDLQPRFTRQVQDWSKHEKMVELGEILELNFFRYDGVGPVPSQIHSYLSSNYKSSRKLGKDDSELKEKALHRWYVPDPKKEGDLEKLRLRSLLKEFETYRSSKSRKIKQFRTESVRAGFKQCYDNREYQVIVDVAAKLPDEVIQEDEKLLMYYDVATMRLGD